MIAHPYNFIPFNRAVDDTKLPAKSGHERFDPRLHSGHFDCVLEARSLLCLKKHFSDLKQTGRAPNLPGSSIKGMLRAFLQSFGAGCADRFKFERPGGSPTWPAPNLEGFSICDETKACLVCRVFGYAAESSGFGWSGKVRVHDSEPAIQWDNSLWQSIPQFGAARLISHGPRHLAFYYPGKKSAGWKVYRHSRRASNTHSSFVSDACVGKGSRFKFCVEYQNLSTEEFAVLQFALSLRHNCNAHDVHLMHKLGYGKGLGLGSCTIEPGPVQPINVRERYLGKQEIRPASDPCILDRYFELPGFSKLSLFMSSEPVDALGYPSAQWFKEHSQDSIDAFERHINPPSPMPPPEPTPVAPKARRVEVIAKSRKNGLTKGTATIEGIEYRWESRENLYDFVAGITYSIGVDTIDPVLKTVTGRVKR